MYKILIERIMMYKILTAHRNEFRSMLNLGRLVFVTWLYEARQRAEKVDFRRARDPARRD